MNLTSVFDTSLLELPFIHGESGNITAINSMAEIPFDISRVYYLYDVPGALQEEDMHIKNYNNLLLQLVVVLILF